MNREGALVDAVEEESWDPGLDDDTLTPMLPFDRDEPPPDEPDEPEPPAEGEEDSGEAASASAAPDQSSTAVEAPVSGVASGSLEAVEVPSVPNVTLPPGERLEPEFRRQVGADSGAAGHTRDAAPEQAAPAQGDAPALPTARAGRRESSGLGFEVDDSVAQTAPPPWWRARSEAAASGDAAATPSAPTSQELGNAVATITTLRRPPVSPSTRHPEAPFRRTTVPRIAATPPQPVRPSAQATSRVVPRTAPATGTSSRSSRARRDSVVPYVVAAVALCAAGLPAWYVLHGPAPAEVPVVPASLEVTEAAPGAAAPLGAPGSSGAAIATAPTGPSELQVVSGRAMSDRPTATAPMATSPAVASKPGAVPGAQAGRRPTTRAARRQSRPVASAPVETAEAPTATAPPPLTAVAVPLALAQTPLPLSRPARTGPALDAGQVEVRPQVERRVDPHYPEHARRRRLEDVVVVRVLVSSTGLPADVRLLRSSKVDPAFDEAAITAVWLWRFSPARKRDQAVDCWFNVGIPFRLSEE